jgi:hypothetical protein
MMGAIQCGQFLEFHQLDLGKGKWGFLGFGDALSRRFLVGHVIRLLSFWFEGFRETRLQRQAAKKQAVNGQQKTRAAVAGGSSAMIGFVP